MSLVNDLLIELDRQQEAAKQSPSRFLEGLTPQRRMRRHFAPSRLASILGLATTVAFVIVGLLVVTKAPLGTRALSVPAVSARLQPAATALPGEDALDLARAASPGSATKPPAVLPAMLNEGRDSGADFRIERRPTLRSVTLEKRSDFARLRLETQGPVVHRIDQRRDGRGLVVFLESATLSAPLSTLDLDGTPIRSLETHSSGLGLELSLRFDTDQRIHSQSLETPDGTTVFIDLSRNASASAVPTGSRSDASKLDRAREPRETVDARSTPRWGEAAEHESASESPSPDPLAISRSAGDKRRVDSNTAKTNATREIAAARLARSEGDLAEADRRYASVIGFLPDYREALVEWASLLGEMNRIDEAIDLIRSARRADAKDPALAMLHAHLLETSQRREEAIALLDRAGFSLTEAPDVHALAAAYLQRAGQHALAIDRYENIVRRYPEKAQWWMGLGISLEAVERQAEAADVYRIAMQIGDLPRPTRRWVSGRIKAIGEGD